MLTPYDILETGYHVTQSIDFGYLVDTAINVGKDLPSLIINDFNSTILETGGKKVTVEDFVLPATCLGVAAVIVGAYAWFVNATEGEFN